MIDNPSFAGYSPLDEGEIRLLRVKDARSLTFEFQTVRIDDTPPYFALSYTWGEPGIHHSIMVNGLAFHVRRNLYDFCSTWVSQWKPDALIWIDAICIDQEKDLERNAQVLIVDAIYNRATCVLCWVGKATANTQSAFDKIKQIADRFASAINNRQGNTSAWRTIDEQDGALLQRNPNDPHSVAAWEGIAELLRCEYFLRTWIVQETVQENTEKILLWGDLHIVWEALGVLDYVLYAKAVSNQLDLPWNYTAMRPGILFNIRERVKKRKETALLELLYSTNSFGCKNPRDKIYAVRSLAHDVGKNDILPKYEKPLAGVYKDVVDFYIEHPIDGQYFGFLGYASNGTQQISEDNSEKLLPSWVPDWRYEMEMFPFPTNKIYRPSLDWQANLYTDGDCLFVEGLKLDTIAHRSPICSPRMIKEVSLDPEWNLVWDQHCMDRGEGSEAESLECVVVADALRSGETTRGHHIDWEFARRARERAEQSYAQSYSSARSFIQTCKSRRLMRTSRGHIGIAPGASKVGDVVCIFFGGQVIYVLRKVDKDSYRYVGESYVQGWMDGEGLSLFEQPLKSKETFCIV